MFIGRECELGVRDRLYILISLDLWSSMGGVVWGKLRSSWLLRPVIYIWRRSLQKLVRILLLSGEFSVEFRKLGRWWG